MCFFLINVEQLGELSPVIKIQHLENHKTCGDLVDFIPKILTSIRLKCIIEIDPYLEPSGNTYDGASLRKIVNGFQPLKKKKKTTLNPTRF